jgi:diguanylate cyclase (GGDEF)-like protein
MRSIGPTPLGGSFPGDASAETGAEFWPEGDWVAGSEGMRAENAGGVPELGTDAASRTPVESPVQEAPTEVATEWPVTDPPSRPAPRLDLIGAQRDVLLWQRWARYVGAVLMAAGALVLRARMPHAGTWELLAALAVAYGAVTALVAWFLGYASAETMPPKLSGLVMSMDLVAAAGTVYLTAPARDYDRLLVLGLGVAQVAVVYYGLSCALWGLAATLVAYVGGSLLLPALVPGPPAVPLTVAADTLTFSFAGAVLLYTFGSFRARMNTLRRFCRDVEVGELGGTFDATTEARPDDLTLLARSVDEMRQRLIELIGTDPLTGCFNRRALETRLARDCRYARRKGTPLAVLAVDVDHFKPINDSFGHPFGDYVLQTVAEILKDTARDTDAVARPGGDEFILVLPDTGWQGATAFAERLRRNVDDHIFGDELTSLQVTVSVGVAVARAVDNHPPEALLAEADRSLYRAKSAGRNRISA